MTDMQTETETPVEKPLTVGEHLRRVGGDLKQTLHSAGGAAGAIVSEARKAVEGAVERGTDVVRREVTARTSQAVDAIGIEPGTERGLAGKIARYMPGLSVAVGFPDAWKKWHAAKAANDESALREARKDILVVLVDGGIDGLFLGTGRFFKAAATAAKVISTTMLVTRLARHLGVSEVDFGAMWAEKAVDTERGKKIADAVAQFVKPRSEAGEPPSQAAIQNLKAAIQDAIKETEEPKEAPAAEIDEEDIEEAYDRVASELEDLAARLRRKAEKQDPGGEGQSGS